MKLRYHVMTETAPTESFDTMDKALAYIHNQVGPVTLDPSEIEDNEHARYMWVYRSASGERFVIGQAV